MSFILYLFEILALFSQLNAEAYGVGLFMVAGNHEGETQVEERTQPISFIDFAHSAVECHTSKMAGSTNSNSARPTLYLLEQTV